MDQKAAISPKELRVGRISVIILVMTILSASLIYALVALDTASELRRRNALDQNSAAAQISARLLDEQWQDLVLVTQELLKDASVQKDMLQHNRGRLAGELKYAVDLVPALMLAAVYTNSGSLVATYPNSPIAPRDAKGTPWFDGVKKHSELFQSDSMRIRLPDQLRTEVIAVAIPIGSRQHPVGYMLELYRVGDVDKWLRDLGMVGSDLYIVNSRGQVVDASTGADRRMQFNKYSSFRQAMNHTSGSLISEHFYSDEDADVGYAFAIRPGWAVIVSRPVSLALAPTRSLVGRLSLLGIIVLALLAAGTTLILRLYRMQDRMALAVTRQNEQLREADRIKSDFLANVSHDLRTPLAAIQISISSLLEPELNWEPEEARESLRVASDSLDQINARVRNLLEMARIEAHAWPLNTEVCDLTDIVGSALERMKSLTAGRELQLSFPESPLLLECDPNQIEAVIVNLLENATKYSPEGSPITVVGLERDRRIRLIIQNTGSKVSPEDVDHIFEKFYRSKIHVSVGGVGLGLAICKSIIEAHNGQIEARNFSIPVTREENHNTMDNVPTFRSFGTDIARLNSTSLVNNRPAVSVENDVRVGVEFSFSLPALCEESELNGE